MEILSNTFKYEDRYNQETQRVEPTAVDYDPRLLTSLNKKEFVHESVEIELKHMMRKNAIVLGDIIEDLDMVTEEKHQEIIKIGFLNDIKNEHLKEVYL